MKKLFRDILTGVDNRSFDNGRVICLLSYSVYFVFAILSVCLHHPWSALDFSGGISAMAICFGVNLKLKKDTEPQ